MRATMRMMFKETKQKCARDQRGVRKAELLETNKMPTKQKTDEGKVSFECVCPQMHFQLIRKHSGSFFIADNL